MYIINAIVFTITLDTVKHEWDKCDAMRTVDVQRVFLGLGDIDDDNREDNVVRKNPSDWTWPTVQRRGSCCYQIFGSGTGPSSWAEFKTLKLYFIQQHYHILKQELGGDHKVSNFDYAQYMRTVVTEEIVELLEVTPFTWAIFLVFLWLLYGLWVAMGYQVSIFFVQLLFHSSSCTFLFFSFSPWPPTTTTFFIDAWLPPPCWLFSCFLQYDNGMTVVSVISSWVLFVVVLMLNIESHRGMQRLHAMVPECFGINPEECTCVEE